MPIWAFASAMARSAAAMSGRRSSNSEGTPIGMGGGAVVIGLTGMEKLERRLADQRGDGVLKLRAGETDIDRLGLHVLQGGLRLNYRQRIVDTGFVPRPGEFEGLLVGFHGRVQDPLQLVLSADLEKDLREAGLFDEAFVLQVGRAELGPVLKLADRVADLAKEIGRPRDVHGQRVDRALLAGEGGDSGGSAGGPRTGKSCPTSAERLYAGEVPMVGKYWARASRISARATRKFW